jgi:serine phosphatase RsbU (regulator of sigma subunit)
VNPITDILPSDVNAADVVYIVDRQLNVIYTNDRWKRFALNNNGGKILNKGWNANILVNMSGKEKERWKHIYRLLLEDRVPHHKENFICSSPVEKRIFQLRITPRKDNDGNVAWLVHHTFWIDERQDSIALLGKRLGDLDDPIRVTREYQQRIFMRTIRIPEFRAARHFKPLEHIGGDLLWHREFPRGVAYLTHADAMGHGVAAGRLATQMAIILDEVTDADLGSGAAVSALNRAILEHAAGDEVVFATGLFFRFDRSGQELTCTNFGHHNPIFSRTGQLYIDGGPPVGLVMEADPWPETRIDILIHGHRFLVFSDGISEQFNTEGEMFGIERLLHAFQRHLELSLEDMLASIIGELNSFRSSAIVKDDQTLLALEFVGDEGKPMV